MNQCPYCEHLFSWPHIDRRSDEVKRLQARVTELEAYQRGLSPDWTSAPTWANYWAMDKDGTSFWYAQEPTLEDYYWNNNGVYSQCEACVAERWIDSLCHRPTAVGK